MISWVFFDLGGTLLDDGPVHELINRKLVELLAARGHAVSMEELLEVRDVLLARQERPLFRALALSFTRDPAVAEAIRKETMASSHRPCLYFDNPSSKMPTAFSHFSASFFSARSS